MILTGYCVLYQIQLWKGDIKMRFPWDAVSFQERRKEEEKGVLKSIPVGLMGSAGEPLQLFSQMVAASEIFPINQIKSPMTLRVYYDSQNSACST